MSMTSKIKQDLWRFYGSDHSWKAEWDGASYGQGGKLSQRMWEYFIAAELMDLKPDSVVLDIGGGSPFSGKPFFAELIAPYVKKVIVMDPNQAAKANRENIVCILEDASRTSLKLVLEHATEVTHVCSISVFEHIPPECRIEIVQAINDYFSGHSFVTTYEYHPVRNHFEHQLTAKTASETFSPLKTFYLDAYLGSPTHCVNAFEQSGNLFHSKVKRLLQGLRLLRPNNETTAIPAWYPCAVRFLRA